MRRARLAAAAALGSALAAAAWVAVHDGMRDREALAGAERSVADAAAALRGGDPARGISLLRGAGAFLAAVDAPPAWRHAWLLAGERSRRAAIGESLAATVAEAAALLDSRSAVLAAVQRMADRVARAADFAELDAVEADARGLEALASRDADALERLGAELRRRRESFEADVRRNEAEIVRLDAELRRAASPAELQSIVDAVLPAPVRRSEDVPLAALRTRAWKARATQLEERKAGLRREAATALDAASARRLSDRADADTDLDRTPGPSPDPRDHDPRDPPEASRSDSDVTHLRSALRDRADALEDWERTLGDGVSAAERGEWQRVHEASARMLEREAAWERAAPGIRQTVADARARLDSGADRGLYEALLRVPNVESALRYVEGCDGHARRMAGPVREWITAAGSAPLEFELIAVRWGATGAPPPGTALEDRPDAEVEVRVEDAPWMRTRFVDVVQGTETAATKGIRCEWRADDRALVRLGARIRIDLRDAIAADPVAIGAMAAPAGTLAGMRTVKLVARDPAWEGPPHELVLRVRYGGVADLPAYSAPPGN